MIAMLRGRLHEKQATRLVVDVGGVGYDVQVPLSTFYHLPDPGGGGRRSASTRTSARTRIALFGFGTALEQQLFERLIAISGIGPRLALAVLSGIEPVDLVRAVQGGDVGRLTLIPGVGKKTAERIGLELKDRLPQQLAAELRRRRPARPPARPRCARISCRRCSTWDIIAPLRRRRSRPP